MKKIVFAFIVLLSASSLCAQDGYTRKMALGFVGSPSVSWLSSNDASVKGDGSIAGFKFGLNSDFYFTPNYAFSTGVLLNNTGGKLQYLDAASLTLGGEPQNIDAGETVRYKITYIEIPLSLKMQTPDFNRFLFFGKFGFSPMFRTGAKNEDGVNLTSEVSLFNMNYHIGGGMEYFISGTTGLTFSVIYSNGFIDVTKNVDSRNDFTKLSAVDFVLGLNF